MAAHVTLYIEPVCEQVETGLWCPHCLKPSGYVLPMKRLTESGVSDFGSLRKCHDCDASLVE